MLAIHHRYPSTSEPRTQRDGLQTELGLQRPHRIRRGHVAQQHRGAIDADRILVCVGPTERHQSVEYYRSRPIPSPRTADPIDHTLELEVRDCIESAFGAVDHDTRPCSTSRPRETKSDAARWRRWSDLGAHDRGPRRRAGRASMRDASRVRDDVREIDDFEVDRSRTWSARRPAPDSVGTCGSRLRPASLKRHAASWSRSATCS